MILSCGKLESSKREIHKEEMHEHVQIFFFSSNGFSETEFSPLFWIGCENWSEVD